MESFGFFGIFKVSTRVLRKNWMHFFYLTVCLILACACYTALVPRPDQKQAALALLHKFSNISNSTSNIDGDAPPDTPPFPGMPAYSPILTVLSLCLSLFTVFVCQPILTSSLFGGYLDKQLSIKSSLKSVPKSFMPLLITMLCLIGAFSVVAIGVTLLGVFVGLVVASTRLKLALTVIIFFLVAATVVIIYLSFVWMLAAIVAILEERSGWDAMRRSSFLLKGHKGVALCLILTFGACQFFIPISISGHETSLSWSVSIFVLNILLLALLSLYSTTTSVVLYISCKHYHNESLQALPAARLFEEDRTSSKYMDLDSFEPSSLTSMVV